MKGFLTTAQAAERLKVTAGRIRQLIAEGNIKGVEKIGRDNFIPVKEIDRIAGSDRKPGRPTKS